MLPRPVFRYKRQRRRRHVLVGLNMKQRKYHSSYSMYLSHRGCVTHLCVSRLGHHWHDNGLAGVCSAARQCWVIVNSSPPSIGSDNGLSPTWRQAIIQTNAVLLSIGSLGTNFHETFFHSSKCRLRNGCHFVQGKMDPWEKNHGHFSGYSYKKNGDNFVSASMC